MKRFYTEAAAQDVTGGFAITLDGRPVRTPKRAQLVVPTLALATMIVSEWATQRDEIVPATMRLTGLANAAIDIVTPDPTAFIAPLAAYAASDLLYYRAPETPLAALQAAAWDPLLDWAEHALDAPLARTVGIMPIAQLPAVVENAGAMLAAHSAFHLAALSPVISIGGSVIVPLAIVARVIDPDTGWQAVTIDERWQEERWGHDAEAAATLAVRHADWCAAHAMLAALEAA